MVQKTGMDGNSILVDVGAGIGRPLLQALAYPRPARVRGIEFDAVKVDKAYTFCQLAIDGSPVLQALLADKAKMPSFVQYSITQVGTLSPCTHIYAFWQGLSPRAKTALALLFRLSSSVRAIAVVQYSFPKGAAPAAAMRAYGFGEVELVEVIRGVKGGNGAYTAYVFRKTTPTALRPAQAVVPPSTNGETTQMVLPHDGSNTAGAMPNLGTLATAISNALFEPHDHAAYLTACRAASCLGDDDLSELLRLAIGKAAAREAVVAAKDAESKEPEGVRGPSALEAALLDGLFRPCVHAPRFEVNRHGVVRRIKDGTPANVKVQHGGHFYARCGHGRKDDRSLPVRNLVAVAWIPGAAELLALDERGVQRRGAGDFRVVHLDDDRANNAVSNLELRRTGAAAKERRKRGASAPPQEVGVHVGPPPDATPAAAGLPVPARSKRRRL